MKFFPCTIKANRVISITKLPSCRKALKKPLTTVLHASAYLESLMHLLIEGNPILGKMFRKEEAEGGLMFRKRGTKRRASAAMDLRKPTLLLGWSSSIKLEEEHLCFHRRFPRD